MTAYPASNVLLLFLLTLSIFGPSYAQSITLSGTVKEKNSQLPLDSVTIKIVNKNNPAEQYITRTNAAGLWSYTVTSVDDNHDALAPAGFTLQQNFPNPFNPSTRILFSTATTGNVYIRVFNILGERIDDRVFFLEAGHHSIDWHGKGAAGVLLYQVESAGKSITRKMIQLDGGNFGGLQVPQTYTGYQQNTAMQNPSASEYLVSASHIIYMPDTVTVPAQNNMQINFALTTVHDAAFVFDLHNDVLEKAVYGYNMGIRNITEQSDLPRFKEGGMDAQMFALWVSPSDTISHTYYGYTLEMIDTFQSHISRNAAIFAQASAHDDILNKAAEGKFVGVLGVEGGHAIENDLQKLRNYYNMGVRYMTITWNNSTAWAVSAQDARSATVGLSDFGKEVIRLMDSLGMMIDVAHTGLKTISDILAVTKNPIIDTHCGARKLNNHYRNLSDSQIDSIAARGGVIGVVFYPPFLSSKNVANIDTVIKHIDYIKNRVGIDYVALGSDYDGIEKVPTGLEDVSKLPKLTEALLRRGYTIPEVRKFLGENYLRVFKRVCR